MGTASYQGNFCITKLAHIEISCARMSCLDNVTHTVNICCGELLYTEVNICLPITAVVTLRFFQTRSVSI